MGGQEAQKVFPLSEKTAGHLLGLPLSPPAIRRSEELSAACPLRLPVPDCQACDHGKEALCDYPYRRGMSLEEVRAITRKQKEMELGSKNDD